MTTLFELIPVEVNQSVSRGTFRACDLVPVFLDLIRDTPEYMQIMQTNNWNLKVMFDPTATDRDERWESEDMAEFLNEMLFDVLDGYSPEGCYFGAHPGDGSDFGYWESSLLD